MHARVCAGNLAARPCLPSRPGVHPLTLAGCRLREYAIVQRLRCGKVRLLATDRRSSLCSQLRCGFACTRLLGAHTHALTLVIASKPTAAVRPGPGADDGQPLQQLARAACQPPCSQLQHSRRRLVTTHGRRRSLSRGYRRPNRRRRGLSRPGRRPSCCLGLDCSQHCVQVLTLASCQVRAHASLCSRLQGGCRLLTTKAAAAASTAATAALAAAAFGRSLRPQPSQQHPGLGRTDSRCSSSHSTAICVCHRVCPAAALVP